MKKHVLITGASGGLGNILVKHAIKLGYTVTTHINKNTVEPDILDYHTYVHGHEPHTITADFSNNPKIDIDKLADISSAIICHGKMFTADPLNFDEEAFIKSFKINCLSAIHIAQSLIDTWLKQKHKGNIVYISSVATRTTAAQEIMYHAAKSATESALSGLSREYAKDGICINVIGPGLMDTPMGIDAITKRPDILTRIPTKQPTSTTEKRSNPWTTKIRTKKSKLDKEADI